MKVVKIAVLSLYAFFSVFLTVSLLSFNEFSNSSFGKVTIIGLKESVGNFSKGDLLIAHSEKDKVKTTDNIYYYEANNNIKKISVSEVKKIMKNSGNYTFVLNDNLFLSDEYLIGEEKSIKRVSFVGYIYNFFTSKLGYFLFVILPIIVSLIYQIFKYRKLR